MKLQRILLCVLAIPTVGISTACTEYYDVHPDLRPLVDCLPPHHEDLECQRYRPPQPVETPDPYAGRNRLPSLGL